MPKIYVSQETKEGAAVAVGAIFSTDMTNWWRTTGEGGYYVETGTRVTVYTRNDEDNNTYFWGWKDGDTSVDKHFVMGTEDVTIIGVVDSIKKPISKVVLGQSDGTQRVIMDLSNSTITDDPAQAEYNFNVVQEGTTFYDKFGVLRTGTNPCTHVVNIQSSEPAAGTPNYVFTIVTQQ